MDEKSPKSKRTGDQDRTARARIRDAAINRFAQDGFASTSVKTIAEDAGVSAPLVIHHFGSKEGLRAECDRYVNEEIWAMKRQMAKVMGSDPLQAIRDAGGRLPLLGYLARTIPDGSKHVDDLIDSMVAETVEFMQQARDAGLVKECEHPREQAIVLVLWQLGALVLHEQARRLLGADLTGPSEETIHWWLPAAEILSKGVIDPRQYEALKRAAEAMPARESAEDRGAEPREPEGRESPQEPGGET